MTGFEDEYRVYEFGKDEFVRLEKEYAEKWDSEKYPRKSKKILHFFMLMSLFPSLQIHHLNVPERQLDILEVGITLI